MTHRASHGTSTKQRRQITQTILQEHTLAEGPICCLLPYVLYTSLEHPSADKFLQGTLKMQQEIILWHLCQSSEFVGTLAKTPELPSAGPLAAPNYEKAT